MDKEFELFTKTCQCDDDKTSKSLSLSLSPRLDT